MSAVKQRETGGGLSLPLIALAGVGLVLVLAAVWLLVWGTEAGDRPSLAVDQERIEFGDVKLDTSLTFQIKVTNTGSSVLKFKQAPYIQIVEGC
ncbi:MAG TPA: hypothetical protein VGK00_06605 [Anaerolineales bacterium]|jgi:nitrogen fixation-related uncharacterized protein